MVRVLATEETAAAAAIVWDHLLILICLAGGLVAIWAWEKRESQ